MLQEKEAARYISLLSPIRPKVAIILGSGLGRFANSIVKNITISYTDIPHFPQSTVEGHAGNLITGFIGNVPVIVMQGRFHYYEGYSMQEVVFPIRTLYMLGIEYLFVSNAVGGLNPDYRIGDIMIIKDHINFFPEHPLRGANNNAIGERFPDMSNTYNANLRKQAKIIAKNNSIPIHEGIYIGSSGPSLETPAEYAMFRTFGADVTGMSTVPEIIVAHHAGIRCFGISVVTNESAHTSQGIITTHSHVQRHAELAEPKLAIIFTELIQSL